MSGKSVVLGLSHSVESRLSALLLKKQGYIVHCLTIMTGDKSSNIYGDVENPRCFDVELESLKKFCDKHDFTFYATDARDQFDNDVINNVIDSRLMGVYSQSCNRCHQLRLSLLYQKMLKLKADFIATAHYAKVLHNADFNLYQVYRGSEIEYDQSHFLSNLNQSVLSHLILPLSELRKSNVIRLAESFELDLAANNAKKGQPFCLSGDIRDFLKTKVAESLLYNKGEVINLETNKVVFEYDGIFNYHIGQEVGKSHNDKQTNYKIVRIEPQKMQLHVVPIGKKIINAIWLDRVNFDDSIDKKQPQRMFLKTSNYQKIYPVTVFFKAINSCLVEFDEPQESFYQGLLVHLYNKNEGLSKLVASGTVARLGPFGQIDRLAGFQDKDNEVEVDQEEDNSEFGF
jgi:tRNA-specific 2-thiouridylase